MKIIGFVNQKGGVGKTTLGMLTCSALAEAPFNYRCAFIDCDHQQSARKQREKDIVVIAEELAFAKAEQDLIEKGEAVTDEALDNLGQKYMHIIREKMIANETEYFKYPIYFTPSDQLTETIVKLEEEDNYDYVFLDMPGQAQGSGLSTLLVALDYAFIPVESGDFDVSSSLDFIQGKLKKFKQWKESKGGTAQLDICVLFNKVEETNVYRGVIQGFKEVFEGDNAVSVIDEKKGLTRSIFYKEHCNTYESALTVKTKDKREKGMQKRFETFLNEILNIINNK